MGKDLTGVRSSHRQLVPDGVGLDQHEPTFLRAIAIKAKTDSWVRLARMRVQPRNPVRETRTPGSVRGAPGNRRPYRGPER